MGEIYVTGFIVVFLFSLLEEVDTTKRLDIKNNIMPIDWRSTLFLCTLFSIFWVIVILLIIISIIQESKQNNNE